MRYYSYFESYTVCDTSVLSHVKHWSDVIDIECFMHFFYKIRVVRRPKFKKLWAEIL